MSGLIKLIEMLMGSTGHGPIPTSHHGGYVSQTKLLMVPGGRQNNAPPPKMCMS